jgi:hypothetical protein
LLLAGATQRDMSRLCINGSIAVQGVPEPGSRALSPGAETASLNDREDLQG